MNVEEVVTRYVESWSETNPARRRAILREIFAEDAGYVDPHVALRGVDAIDGFIGQVQQKYPGVVFRLAGKVDAHHEQARFTWHAGPAGAPALAIGFDVAVFDGGRIRQVYGFLDKSP